MPRALRREVRHDPGGGIDATGILGEKMDHAAAKGEAASPQGLRLERQPPNLVDCRPSTKVAAEQDRRNRPGQAAGGRRDVGEDGVALDLLDTRVPDRAAHGHQTSGFFHAAGDQRRDGQALDVLHQGRTAVDAPFEGPRRSGRRPGIASVDEVDGCRLLPGHVTVWRRDQASAALQLMRPLAQRLRHGRLGRTMRGAYIKDDVGRPNRVSGEQGAVDDEVRAVRHQDAILHAQGFTLGTVRQDHASAFRSLGDGAPLARHRETGAAASDEVGGLNSIDQSARRRHRQGPGRVAEQPSHSRPPDATTSATRDSTARPAPQ